VWYEKGGHWVMAVYDEFEKKQGIAFYTSPDLKEWTFASRIEGFFECPDLFKMPVLSLEQVKDNSKWTVVGSRWVLYAADGKYLLGEFDGKTFKPDFKEKKQLWYGRFYAAQTFDSPPLHKREKGADPEVFTRRVQIGWAQGVTFPGTPFNQQMTVPVELGLRARIGDRDQGLRLDAGPVVEALALRDGKPVFEVKRSAPRDCKERLTLADELDAFEANFHIATADIDFTLDLRGTKLDYDARKGTLTCKDVTAPVPNGSVDLQVLVDRGSVEVFANGGLVAMSIAAIPDEKNRKLELIPQGEITIISAEVYRLKSAWEK
jgi:fructan beta-fructosidase